MSALLARPPRPTATVCFNDVTAIGAMLALARHGLVAGHDMAVTGFDDTAEAAQLSPALTTVAVDAARLGAEAAAMLLRRIDAQSLPEPELDPTQTFLGDTQLIIRQSSGAPLLHRTSA